MQTRKYPRTMQEAFGPYTDHRLEVDEAYDMADFAVIVASAVIGVVTVAMIALGWI